MAIALAASDRIKLRILCRLDDQLGENVLDYRTGPVTGGPTDVELAGAISAIIAPLYKAFLCGIAEYRGVLLQVRRADTFFPQTFSIVGQGAGGAIGEAMPRQTSGITSKRTALGGKANHGRIYWPFPAVEAGALDAKPGDNQMLRMTNLATQLLGAQTYVMGGGTVVLNPELGHKKKADGTTLGPTPITGFTTERKWATQRRRSSFGAPNPLLV